MKIAKNRNRSPFSFANINLLGKCNLDCLFCLGKDLAIEFSKFDQTQIHFSEWSNFEKFLSLCKEHNIENIYITGQNTDSLLYKHLKELIVFLQDDREFKVGLRTNGLLAHKRIPIINLCKKSISYTLLTLNPWTMEAIAGKSHIPDFGVVFNKITIPQRVATVITIYNEREFFDLVKFVAKYPRIKYFQVRRVSTDFRQEEMQSHQEAFDRLHTHVATVFPLINQYEGAPEYNIYGVPVVFWKTVSTTANSINYFTNGVVSNEYFVVEGYLKNKGETCLEKKTL